MTKKAACEAELVADSQSTVQKEQNELNNIINEKKIDKNEVITGESDESIKGSKDSWGYDLYPERRGAFKPAIKKILLTSQGKEAIDKMKCERTVFDCIQTSAAVKLMMGALKSSGCPIDIRRHISCEVCDETVTGGYDPELNQIVVCQNMAKKKGIIQSVLAHEMIHMFDFCRKDLNFKNMEHLACTEIRAANLTHCSFMSAWSQGDANFVKVAKAHQDCVKTKALYSVLAVRQISKEEAVEVVQKVFPYCYNDLEPIGRRIKRNSNDIDKALREAKYYGYLPS